MTLHYYQCVGMHDVRAHTAGRVNVMLMSEERLLVISLMHSLSLVCRSSASAAGSLFAASAGQKNHSQVKLIEQRQTNISKSQ